VQKLELQATGRNDPEVNHHQNEAYGRADHIDPFPRNGANNQQTELNNHRRQSTKYA